MKVARSLGVGLEAGFTIAALGAVLWVTGRPFVFPSLGPTAFMLALQPGRHSGREVLGGHLWGVVAGLVAYHVLAGGLTLSSMPSGWSQEALRLTASATSSVLLTATAMVATRTVHAPACATTLIVSLGILPLLADGLVIMIGVMFLYALHLGIRYVRGSPGVAAQPDDRTQGTSA